MTKPHILVLGTLLLTTVSVLSQIVSISASERKEATQPTIVLVTLGDPVPATETARPEATRLEPAAELAAPSAPPSSIWGSAEYLLWWINQGRVPPLITASAPGSAAILGPDTVVLFGGSRLSNTEHSGGRFVLGTWLNEQRTVGVEINYFFLNPGSTRFQVVSNGAPGSPAIGRPFFDASINKENSELVAFPGLLAGAAGVNASSRLQGWEGLGVCQLCCGSCCKSCGSPGWWRVQAVYGFRYLELNEGLGISEDLTVLPTVPVIGGSKFRVLDQFDTANRFYGGVVGLRGEYARNNWSLSASTKLALGDSHQVVNINGGTLFTSPAGSSVFQQGGLLALAPNIGRYERDRLAFVPEVGVNLGYWLTPSLRATVGYTLLYISNVARPGDQINRTINPSLLPIGPSAIAATGPAQPAFFFRDTDFWAQGISFGLEFRY